MRARLFLVVTVTLLAVSILGRGLNADRGFSNKDLSGGYSGSGTGLLWFTPPGASPTPFKLDLVTTSFTNYDGAGNCTGSVSQAQALTFGAAPLATCIGTFSCTYSVNPDGTGTSTNTLTFTSGPCINSTVTDSFVLGEGGKLVNSIVTSDAIPAVDGTVTSIVDKETKTRQ